MHVSNSDLAMKAAGAIRGNDGIRPHVNAVRRRQDREEIAMAMVDDSAEEAQLDWDIKEIGCIGYDYDTGEYDYDTDVWREEGFLYEVGRGR